LGYLAATVIVVVVGLAAAGFMVVRHENRPIPRPAPMGVRRMVRRAPRAAAGDSCVCGGTVGKTGKTSARWGDLLGCTGCDRSWTMDGRRILRRIRRPSQPH
jgi:hypothetical protein